MDDQNAIETLDAVTESFRAWLADEFTPLATTAHAAMSAASAANGGTYSNELRNAITRNQREAGAMFWEFVNKGSDVMKVGRVRT